MPYVYEGKVRSYQTPKVTFPDGVIIKLKPEFKAHRCQGFAFYVGPQTGQSSRCSERATFMFSGKFFCNGCLGDATVDALRYTFPGEEF